MTVRVGGRRIVCERCLVADTPRLRLRGLLGRRGLPAGTGMWIRPVASVHTFFMRFAIDAVFLDRDDVVLAVVAPLRPWRVATRRRARSVLELAAGEALRRGVGIGDRLVAGPAAAVRPGSCGFHTAIHPRCGELSAMSMTFPHRRLGTVLRATLVAGALVLALPAVSSAEAIDAPVGAAAPAAAPPQYMTPVYHLRLAPSRRTKAAPATSRTPHRKVRKARRAASSLRSTYS